MQLIKRFWVKISNLGIPNQASKYLKLRLRLINQAWFVIFSVTLINFFLFLNDDSILQTIYITLVVSGIGLLISYWGKTYWVRHYFLGIATITLMMIAAVEDGDSNHYIFTYPWVATAYLLFRSVKIRRIYLVLFFITLLITYHFSFNLTLDDYSISVLNPLYGLIIAFFLLVGILNYFDLEYRRYSIELEENNRKLKESKAVVDELYEGLYFNSPMGIAFSNAEGIIERVNDKVSEISGYEPTELIGMPLFTLLREEDRESCGMGIHNTIVNKGKHFNKVAGLKSKDGSRIDVNFTLSLNWGADGTLKSRIVTMQDISERVSAERAVRENEKRYRTLFQTNQAGIVVFDLGFNFVEVNPAFCELSGYTKGELLAMQVSQINLTGLPTSEEELLRHFSSPDAPLYKGEGRYEKKDGTGVYALISVIGEYNELGHLRGFIVTVVDFTKQKEFEENSKRLFRELEESNEALEAQSYQLTLINNSLKQSNLELEQFAYVASHDLQEPLRMIGNFVQLLELDYAEELNDEGKMYINYAVDGVTRMSKLIDDLLQYSRVGKKKLIIEDVNIEEVLKTKIRDLSHRIQQKNGVVLFENMPIIQGDKTQISIVFFNLINNGLKFNKSEQPTITITCQEKPKDWVFSIADNGIGIDKKNQKKIFEIFKRLHRKEEYEGTGIGLAIVRRIILRHLGKIWIRSKLGKGTIFYFSIPKEIELEH